MHWALEQLLVGRADRQTIAKYATGADRMLGILLMLSAALLGLALTQPLLTAGGFMALAGEYSLLELIKALFLSGRGAMALIIALFVIVFPVVLLSLAFDVWYKFELGGDKFERKSARLRALGRLVLPVFALIPIALYLAGREADVILHGAGLYLVASFALLKIATARMQPLTRAVRFVDAEEN